MVLDGMEETRAERFCVMLDRRGWLDKRKLGDHGCNLHRRFTPFPHPEGDLRYVWLQVTDCGGCTLASKDYFAPFATGRQRQGYISHTASHY